MELNFDKIKTYATVAITVISGIISSGFYAKDYINSNYVSRSEFNDLRTLASRHVLENRKLILENRIYFLTLCKVTAECAYKATADLEVEKAMRELSDIRGHLGALHRRDIE
jgi:hypothetical protein